MYPLQELFYAYYMRFNYEHEEGITNVYYSTKCSFKSSILHIYILRI